MGVSDTPSVTNGMQSRGASQQTLVYLFSGDHDLDGELKAAQRFQSEAAKNGGKVVIIGDGQHMLSSDEVRAGLSQVKGNYNLVISAHGMDDNGSLRMSFLQSGADLQGALSKQEGILKAHGVTDAMLQNPNDSNVGAIADKFQGELAHNTWASAGDILKMLPPGVQSVMTSACHGEAIKAETSNLPSGVPVFSVALGEIPAAVRDVDRGLQGVSAAAGKPPNPTDLYLNYVVNGVDVGYAQKQLQAYRQTGSLPGFSEVLPSEIMSKGQSINLATPIVKGTPVAISANSVDRITNMVMAGEHQQNYFGTTPDGKPILDENGKIKPQEFTRDAVRAEVQKVADAIAKGNLKPEGGLMVYADSSNPANHHMRVLTNAQVAVGLVGAEVDARATANNVDMTKAYKDLMAPSAPDKPALGGNRAGLRSVSSSAPAAASVDAQPSAVMASAPPRASLRASAIVSPATTTPDVPSTTQTSPSSAPPQARGAYAALHT